VELIAASLWLHAPAGTILHAECGVIKCDWVWPNESCGVIKCDWVWPNESCMVDEFASRRINYLEVENLPAYSVGVYDYMKRIGVLE
jgi:hypothetical protein